MVLMPRCLAIISGRDERTRDYVVEQVSQARGGAAVGELAGEQGVGASPAIVVFEAGRDGGRDGLRMAGLQARE